jgi:hypothetical protein
MSRIATLVLAATVAAAPAFAEDMTARAAASREASKRLGEALKAELQAAVQAGGPIQAIGVCNEKAPGITQQVSAQSGFEVSRTSLRVRNPGNAPDEWERKVLEDFSSRAAAGQDLKTMEHHEVVESGGKRQFRYMKAIPLAELCVVCHGKDLAPEVAAKVDQLYPQDRARGFAPGELRGAFSVTQSLP